MSLSWLEKAICWPAIDQSVDDPLPKNMRTIIPIKQLQVRYARRALELHKGNYSAAAQALGVSPNTLRYSYLSEKGHPKNPCSH